MSYTVEKGGSRNKDKESHYAQRKEEERMRLGRSFPEHPALPDKKPLTGADAAVDLPLCLLQSLWALQEGTIRNTMNN